MIVGYARTSTLEQEAGLEAQIKELEKVGCEKIYQEQVSSVAVREQLNAALGFLREGDMFVVTKLDRLARSVSDLLKIVSVLEKRKASLRILNLGIDTTTPTGKLMLTMLGAVGEFEREIMLERQREGIAKAKAEGKYRGRKPLAKEIVEEILRLSQTRMTREKVAERMDIGVATVYRVLKEHWLKRNTA